MAIVTRDSSPQKLKKKGITKETVGVEEKQKADLESTGPLWVKSTDKTIIKLK